MNRIVFLWPALQSFYTKKEDVDPSGGYDAELIVDRDDFKLYKKLLEFLCPVIQLLRAFETRKHPVAPCVLPHLIRLIYSKKLLLSKFDEYGTS